MNQRSDLERIHALETSVTVLNKDSDIHTRTLEKIDDVIDRAETHIEAINRSISTYDEKLRSQEKTNDRIEDSMKDLQSYIKELEEKLEDQHERRMLFLEEMKKDLIVRIDSVTIKQINHDTEISKKEKESFKIYKFLVDNWKTFLFVVAILGGLMFNKWGLLTSLLGG